MSTGFPFITNPSLVRFGVRDIAPAAPTYVTLDDRILVTSVASINAAFYVTWRVLTPNGEIILQRESFSNAGGRLPEYRRRPLAEGFLLSVEVSDVDQIFIEGSLFVMVEIVRNDTAVDPNQPAVGTSMKLVSGYCFWLHPLGWPGDDSGSPQSGPGRHYIVTQANPAAGADYTFLNPANALWELIALRFRLVTSVAVATRTVHFLVDDGANIVCNIPSPSTQLASITQDYNLGTTYQSTAVVDGQVLMPLPQGIRVRRNFRIRTLTTNLQGADQFSLFAAEVEEWLTN